MSKAKRSAVAYLINGWRVFPESGQIERDGQSARLEPKVMGVLLCLIERRGEVVSKDVLVDKVWGGRAVSDIVITRCVSVLRSNLGDNPRSPSCIETLPKRGYRLIAEVSEVPTPSGEASEKSTTVFSRRRILLASIAIVGAILALNRFYFSAPAAPDTVAARSIAVLPFVNMSGPDQQYLCDGISEQLIFTLSQVPELEIAARTSSFSFRNSEADVRSIGRELSVALIVEGSVRRAGDTVRVTAQLVDSESGYQVWAGSFDGAIEDTFDLQERISQEVAAAVVDNPSRGSYERVSYSRPKSFAAYDKFLIGRFVLNQRREDSLKQAVTLFDESIALDPSFGPSYLGLAYAYALLPSYQPVDARATYDKALGTLDRGIAADNNIASVGAGVRGFVQMKRGNWLAAEKQFQHALESRYVEATSYLWYSQLLATVGRLDDSLALAVRGREIDPLSPVANSRLAIASLWAGDNIGARRYFDIAATLSIDSPIHTESFALLLIRERRFVDVEGLAQSIKLEPGRDVAWLPALLRAIDRPELRDSALTELNTAIRDDRVSPRVALVALGLLSATAEAAALVQALIDRRDAFEYEVLFVDELAGYREHPEFASIMNQLGIADYWQAIGCEWREAALHCE